MTDDSARRQLKVWVDDERPAPEGWVWSKTVANTIDTLMLGDVDELSLDYCLSGGETGQDVLEWLRDHPDRWPGVIHAHSGSSAGRELLELLISDWSPAPTDSGDAL